MGWLQKISLQRELDSRRPHQLRVFSAYINWHPFITEVVEQIVRSGIERVIALPLAPQFDPASLPELAEQLNSARTIASGEFELTFLDPFSTESRFGSLVATRLPSLVNEETIVYFTTSAPRDGLDHALVLERLKNFVSPLADSLGLTHWDVAFERNEAGWPDGALLAKLKSSPHPSRAVVVSMGTTTDSYATDFGIDVECGEVLRRRGIEMHRVDALNHDDAFMGFLADAVEAALDR